MSAIWTVLRPLYRAMDCGSEFVLSRYIRLEVEGPQHLEVSIRTVSYEVDMNRIHFFLSLLQSDFKHLPRIRRTMLLLTPTQEPLIHD